MRPSGYTCLLNYSSQQLTNSAQMLREQLAQREARVDSLRRQIEARKGALAAQKSFIESVKVAWGDRISKELAVGKPTATELNEALAFVGTGINYLAVWVSAKGAFHGISLFSMLVKCITSMVASAIISRASSSA